MSGEPSSAPIIPPDDRTLQLMYEREILARLNCHQVGTIASFNPANGVVTAKVNMTATLNGQAVPYPVFSGILIVANGGGGALTFPIAIGDPCLILFNDRDLDSWWTSSQTNLPPNTGRLHDFSDGLIIVGPFSRQGFATAFPSYSSTDTQLTGPSGTLVSLGSKVGISNGSGSLKQVVDLLVSVLVAWVNTDTTTPNPATIAALNSVQTLSDSIFK